MKEKTKRGSGFVSLLFAAALALGLTPTSALAANDSLQPDTGSLTIHKYLSEDGTGVPGNANDGEQVTPEPGAEWTKANGIKFNLYSVAPGAYAESSGTATAKTGQEADYPGQRPYHKVTVGGQDYVKDAAGDLFKITAAPAPNDVLTTAGGGLATASGLNKGVYFVEEQKDTQEAADAAGRKLVTSPADPFVVSVPMSKDDDGDKKADSWITDVHVYPKNFSMSVEKEIKSPAGSEQTGSAVNVGDTVTYSIIPAPPKDVVDGKIDPLTGQDKSPWEASDDDAKIEYSVTDQLDEALTFAGASSVHVYGLKTGEDKHDGGKTAEFAQGTDYNVTETGGKVTVTFTQAGRAKIHIGSGTTADPEPYPSIRVEISATVNSKILDASHATPDVDGSTSHEIWNQAETVFKNKFEEESSVPSNKVEVHTAAIEITKKDNTELTALEGAEFKIADSLQNAKDGKYLRVDAAGNIIDPADAKWAGLGESADWTETSAATTGKIVFDGVEDYTSVMNADGTETKTPCKYYLVEVKAPDGYNLLPDPVEVDFGSAGYDSKDANYVVFLDIMNTNEFVLPLTGGAGTMLLTVAGVVLVGGGAIALLFSRKKKGALK